jgi:dTDP-4-dehydrorhamnose 3,5-epimerase
MSLDIHETGLDGLLVVKPKMFQDNRGFIYEVFNEDTWRAAGLDLRVKQINLSRSSLGVVRGLHFQWDPPMGKLMRVNLGRAFMVAVDIRYKSPSRGKWYGVEASAEDRIQLWGGAGFARGFCALSANTEIQYLCTGTYNPKAESGIIWNDPAIGIVWPVQEPILSDKDRAARSLADWLATPEAKKID